MRPQLILLFFLLALDVFASGKPNVLFIAIDDMNDMVGFLKGHHGIQTPHLNQLAEQSVNFTKAYCAAPACSPSRVAVMTGLLPSTSGIYSNKQDWREVLQVRNAISIPDSFQAAGYLTRGGGKVYHAHTLRNEALTGFVDLGPWDGFFPGDGRQMPDEVTPASWPVHGSGHYQGRFDWAPLDIEDDEMADGKVIAWAEQQLGTSHEKPLFLAVGIYRPHIPWWTPKKYFDLYPIDAIELPEILESDLDDIPSTGREHARRHWHKWMIDNDQWKKAMQGYFASISFADAMVGRLLAAVRNGPLSGNTIIVLWSDHGYHLGHKEHWEKFALWEQTTHVPLLVADTRPGGIGSGTCSQPVSLIDIYPTLIDLCELSPVEGLDGESLLPLLTSPGTKTGRAVVTTHGIQNHAIRSERWRYIRYADGSEELYDHKFDPAEFSNLARAPHLASVKANLAKWLPKINKKPDEHHTR